MTALATPTTFSPLWCDGCHRPCGWRSDDEEIDALIACSEECLAKLNPDTREADAREEHLERFGHGGRI